MSPFADATASPRAVLGVALGAGALVAVVAGIVLWSREPGARAKTPPATSTSSVAAGARGHGSTSAATSSAASGSSAPAASGPPSALPTATARAPRPKGPYQFEDKLDLSTFYRGNIHTHSKWSDGDTHPKDVFVWYGSHGYDFLAMTDHNFRTDPRLFQGSIRIRAKHKFAGVPGEEITLTSKHKPVHVNGLCTKKTIGGHKDFASPSAALAWALEKVHEQGGIALVNHPNFDWALTQSDVMTASGAAMLEIWSGHPWVHSEGDEARPSHEAIWDATIRAGHTFAGVAVDDSHHFQPVAREPAARPGRAWIWVAAEKNEAKALCDAMRARKLYASTGPRLERIKVEGTTLTLSTREKVTVEFVGELAPGGVPSDRTVTLERVEGLEGGEISYELRGEETYVRARIVGDKGTMAWTQAFRTVPKP